MEYAQAYIIKCFVGFWGFRIIPMWYELYTMFDSNDYRFAKGTVYNEIIEVEVEEEKHTNLPHEEKRDQVPRRGENSISLCCFMRRRRGASDSHIFGILFCDGWCIS